MEEGQHQASIQVGSLSSFPSIFGLEQPVEDVALGDVAFGASSAARPDHNQTSKCFSRR